MLVDPAGGFAEGGFGSTKTFPGRDAPGADLGRRDGLGVAVPAPHPPLAPRAELLGFASLALEESGAGAAGFGTCGFGPALFGKGMVWHREQPRALAGLPFPSFPGGFLLLWTCWMGACGAGREESVSVDDLARRRVLVAMLCRLGCLLTWKMRLGW